MIWVGVWIKALGLGVGILLGFCKSVLDCTESLEEVLWRLLWYAIDVLKS